ncbi:MAG: hypothetical protein ABSA33_03275, partial [Candidatus Micrarchaeaceae archaeon]
MNKPQTKRITIPIVLAIILTCITVFMFLPHATYAQSGAALTLAVANPDELHQSTLDCASVGGSWSNCTYTCTVNGGGNIGAGSTLSIYSGATLVITNGATFSLSGYIYQGSGSTFTNAGTLQINSNGGQYSSSAGSSFTNTGTITNGNGGNSGYAYIFASGGTFTNKGTINNMKDGAIQDLNSQSNPG